MLVNSSPVWKQTASYSKCFWWLLEWNLCMCLCILFKHKSIFKLNCLRMMMTIRLYSFNWVQLLMIIIKTISFLHPLSHEPCLTWMYSLMACSLPQVAWLVNQPSLTDFEFYSEFLWMQAISGHYKLENIVIKRSKTGHVYIL